MPGKGLDVVIVICPGSAAAGEEPDRRDPGQTPWVTDAAVRWRGSPQLPGGSTGKSEEQVGSHSETFPPFKIKYFLIYINSYFIVSRTFLRCSFIPVNVTGVAELSPGQ